MNEIVSSNRWPPWSRRSHPIVQRYLRQAISPHFNLLIVISVIILFLLFGSLSLPMLYFLFSLMVLMNLAVGTANKMLLERSSLTWDLMRAAPFSQSEILLSLWSASLWQLRQTWVISMYRFLQGMLVVGAMVFGLWFAEIPPSQWPVILVTGTVIIIAQPYAEMYYSGMVGLLAASVIRDRTNALLATIVAVLFYWLGWISLVGVLVFSGLNALTLLHLALAFTIPLAVPLALGGAAFAAVRFNMS